MNLHEVLTLEDLEKGYKKLKKKKRFKNSPEDLGDFFRFEKNVSSSNFTALGKFIDTIQTNYPESIINLYNEFKDYDLSPFVALSIEKSTKGKFRPLLVPKPKDRLVFDSLYTYYKKFLFGSLKQRDLLGLGLEKKQSISKIIKRIHRFYIRRGYKYALSLDYSSFFSEINRELLYKKLSDVLPKNYLDVLKEIIENEIENADAVEKCTGVKLLGRGIPQGLSFSPLLACFYALDIDDLYLKNKKIKGFRYIDDIIILSKDKVVLLDFYKKIEKISKDLDMKLHPLIDGGKTKLVDLDVDKKIKFLGIEMDYDSVIVPETVYEVFLEKIRRQILNDRIILDYSTEKIKENYINFIRGWLNHYESLMPKNLDIKEKLDTMIKFYCTRKKKTIRKGFYTKNLSWISISDNQIFSKKKKKQ